MTILTCPTCQTPVDSRHAWYIRQTEVGQLGYCTSDCKDKAIELRMDE